MSSDSAGVPTPDPKDHPFARAWFLVGPTASGKSAIALEIAKRVELEIIALDSMTLYRHLDIGTAKPSLGDQAQVRHHLLDELDPTQSATIDWYLDRARTVVQDIEARGKQALFVGGTPLYLKALLRGLFDGPPADPAFRDAMLAFADEFGNQALHDRLRAVDELSARRLAVNDRRRIIRALEVFEQTNTPISTLQQEFDKPATVPIKAACLVWPRAELVKRIGARVEAMFQAGWVEETKQVLAQYGPLARGPSQAVGYQLIARYLAGELSLADAKQQTITRTCQFAKHQMTWYRHLEELTWFHAHEGMPTQQLVEDVHRFFNT